MSSRTSAASRARGPARARKYFVLSVLLLPVLVVFAWLLYDGDWRQSILAFSAARACSCGESAPTKSSEPSQTRPTADLGYASCHLGRRQCFPGLYRDRPVLFSLLALSHLAPPSALVVCCRCATVSAPTFDRVLCFSGFSEKPGTVYGGHIAATILLTITKQEKTGANDRSYPLQERVPRARVLLVALPLRVMRHSFLRFNAQLISTPLFGAAFFLLQTERS